MLLCMSMFLVSISLSGESLHKRGYRLEGGRAPLKENLAAAILIRSGWMAALAKGQSCLIDPMCGSGTLLIEAAMMAYDIAPGINRNYFGFMGWRGHRASIWQKLLEDANTRRDEKLANPFTEIMGFDVNSRALEYAEENITRANLHAIIKVQQQDAGVITREGINSAAGLIVCNPPYGERLQKDEEDALKQLFSDFGKALREHFNGWELAIFSGSPQLLKSLGIRSYKIYKLFNGALPCELLKFHLTDEYFMRFESLVEKQARRAEAILANITEQGRMFAHRLEKNAKHLSKWAKRSDITCYRIYDADLPDYAIAIDKYQQWIHVQEYQADKEIDPKKDFTNTKRSYFLKSSSKTKRG